MSEKQAKFLPFHSINEFMLPEYRQTVLTAVFNHLEQLSGARRGTINALVRRMVSVPGFRNSALAPTPMKIKGSAQGFERYPEFVAQILQAWSEINAPLAAQVYELLKARGWEILPPEADRSKLPGFLTEWPAADTYDVLNETFRTLYPDSTASEDDVRLMAVWIGGRLPDSVTEGPDEAEEE
mgnify:FL=1